MVRSIYVGYKPTSAGIDCFSSATSNMGMSRVLSRFLTVCIFIVAFLSMWDLYYYMNINDNVTEENYKLQLIQGRGRVIHGMKNRKTTVEEILKAKSNHLDFMKEQKVMQINRKRSLQDACRKIPANNAVSRYTKRHVYVVDQFKLAYCFVPKVGCSNWKRILMVLNGERDSVDGLTSNEVHCQAKMKFLDAYTKDEQEHILKNYQWFLFVREPFQRALSVYRNKFEDYKYYISNENFHRFGKKIVQKWRINPSMNALQSGANVTWTEFAHYLTHPVEREQFEDDWHYSDHWREMYKICSPCTIDYDFIGKLETVATDAKYILKSLGVEDKVSYLSSETSKPTNSSSRATYQKYFHQLGKDEITRLWDLYKIDYELFNYTRPDIVP